MIKKDNTRRRATDEDVRRALLRPPKTTWDMPANYLPALQCRLETRVDLGWLSGQMNKRLVVKQREHHSVMDVLVSGAYRRVEAGESVTLSHPQLGECYVDSATKSYLHFDRSQLPVGDLEALKGESFDCTLSIAEKKDNYKVATVRIRGPVRLDWVLTLTEAEGLLPYTDALFDLLIAEHAALGAKGIPLEEIKKHGVPSQTKVWVVNAKGKRTRCAAERSVREMKVIEIEGAVFAPPAGYRDMRRRGDDKEAKEKIWYPVPTPERRARDVSRPATGSLVAVREPPDISLPQCLPSTYDVVAVSEARQELFEHIKFLVNLASSRLRRFEGTRAGNDETEVTLKIDWLAQMKEFHDSFPDGDAVFCLLRDSPPPNNPDGWVGFLDRFAAALGEELLEEAEEPLPLGGEDDPLSLPREVVDELERVVADEGVEQTERWGSLRAEHQAAIRDAIIDQRFGVIEESFEGGSGQLTYPNESLKLVHARLQLETVALDLERREILRGLRISAREGGSRPGVDVTLFIPSFEVELTLSRRPGPDFWVTAAGLLVVGGLVAATAVGATITLLIGMGPLGLVVLLGMLSALPTLAVVSAALMSAVVTFLVWDVATVRVSITDMELRTLIHPDVTGGAEMAPDVDDLSLDGSIVVSYSTEVPPDTNRVIAWIAEAAVNIFDLARGTITGEFARRIEKLVAIPHFRLPVPFRRQLENGELALTHELKAIGAEGEDAHRISAVAVTRPVLKPRERGPYTTQMDLDVAPRLQALMDEIDVRGTVYLGYAFSQNLLNAYVHAQWASGLFAVEYPEDEIREAHALAAQACAKCECEDEQRFVHVWAAACPRVLVTVRDFWEDGRRPYLVAEFPDVRLCVSCAGKEKEWRLEIQFAIRAIAHLGFGTNTGLGGRLSLFSRGRTFVDVYYDRRGDDWQVTPTGIQGLAGDGEMGGRLDSMSDAERVQLLRDFQGILDGAGRRLTRSRRADPIQFAGQGIFNRQSYDGIIRATLVPHRTTVYAAFSPFGAVLSLLPSIGEDGVIGPPTIELEGLGCSYVRDGLSGLIDN